MNEAYKEVFIKDSKGKMLLKLSYFDDERFAENKILNEIILEYKNKAITHIHLLSEEKAAVCNKPLSFWERLMSWFKNE